jgi:repressor LexA
MKNSNTSLRLKQIMSERNLRQVDILNAAKPYCAKYGIKLEKSDLSQYVNGKVEPGQEKLTILGLALGVNETWLMGYDISSSRTDSAPLPKNVIPMPEMRKIPLIGTIACGSPIMAEEHIEEYLDIPKHIHADFALTCKGDSMINARIFDGDIVYIRQQDTVENGEIAAVLNGDGEATLKRVKIHPDRIILEPENPMYDPLVYRNEEMNSVRILGKAVAFTSAIR